MDIAEVAFVFSILGCIVLVVVCLSLSFDAGSSRLRHLLAAALLATLALGGVVTAGLLSASQSGVHSIPMNSPIFSTASTAGRWGVVSLVATLAAAAVALSVALLRGRPRLALIGMASAAAAFFVLSLVAGWWMNVERWAG